MRIVVSLLCLLLALPALAGDVKTMEPEELLETLKVKADAVLVLDVRSEKEYASGHVPGAVHIPYDELESRLDEVAERHPDRIVVYCEVGGRAGKAEAVLQEAGYAEVYDLDGHMREWRKEKRPTKRPLAGAGSGEH